MDEVINVSALVLRVGTDKLTNKSGWRRIVALRFNGTELKISFEGSDRYNQDNLKWKYKRVKLIPSQRCYTRREGEASGEKVLMPISGVGYDTLQADGLSLMYELPPAYQRAQMRRILKPSKLQQRQSTTHSTPPSLTQPPSDTPTITNASVKPEELELEAGKEIVEHRILGYVLKTPERDCIELPFRDSKPDGAYIDAAQGVPSLFVLAVEAVAQEIRELQKVKQENLEAAVKLKWDVEDQKLQPVQKLESRLRDWKQNEENKLREQEQQLFAKFRRLEWQMRARKQRHVVQLQEQRQRVLADFQEHEEQLEVRKRQLLKQLQPKYQAMIGDVEKKYGSAIEERRAFISELPQGNLTMCASCCSVSSADKVIKCYICARRLCHECSKNKAFDVARMNVGMVCRDNTFCEWFGYNAAKIKSVSVPSNDVSCS